MMTSEKFCLQWKEFQENVRFSYKEVNLTKLPWPIFTMCLQIRRTGEFSDVTLACEDGQLIRAHKVSVNHQRNLNLKS